MQKRVGELEIEEKLEFYLKIKKLVWGLLFGARTCKEEGRRKLGLQRTRDFKV